MQSSHVVFVRPRHAHSVVGALEAVVRPVLQHIPYVDCYGAWAWIHWHPVALGQGLCCRNALAGAQLQACLTCARVTHAFEI